MSTQNLKIITALWGQKYSTDDVKKLPIDIVFSDREVPGIETRPINMSYKGTWKKMTLFDSRLDLGDCLFLDLDIILQKHPDLFFYPTLPTLFLYLQLFGATFFFQKKLA